MFTNQVSRSLVERAVFMFVAAIIVTAGLSLNAFAVQPEQVDYSVTVTQLA